MTDEQLLALPKVGPDEASAFLDGEVTAQYIRLWCQCGDCPFGAALKMSPHRYNYTINRRRLIKYRNGDIPPSLPTVIADFLDRLTLEAVIMKTKG